MMFTIQPEHLLRMIETADQAKPGSAATNDVACLQASRGRVALECHGTVAETNSVVWTDGRCRLALSELLAVLRRFRFEPLVTIDVKYGLLRIRHSAVPVLGLCAWTPICSETEQRDFATD